MSRSVGRLVPALIAFLLAGPTAALADELAERALAAMGAIDSEGWSFTETTDLNGTEVVKTHDASRPEGNRWTVVSVDGRTPTDKERGKYLEPEVGAEANDGEPVEAATDADADEHDAEIRAMIEPGSLELLDESATHATYRFRPAADGGDDAEMVEHLDGTLRINRDGPYVESIEMRSRAPFSPQFGVKVKEFSTLLTFAPIGPDRAVLPATVDVRFAGKAFLVKKIDETVRIRYSDYRRSES